MLGQSMPASFAFQSTINMKNTYSNFVKALVLSLIVLVALHPAKTLAQSSYTILSDKNTTIRVSGKSNVHDWSLASATMESRGQFNFDLHDKLNALNGFTFNVATKSLKSGKSMLDNRTYKAMKAEEFPRIYYKLATAVISPGQKNTYLLKSTGDLTIAGVVQRISMDLTVVINADNTLTCAGTKNIKLTDYKISPPSYMLGAMKVYNDIVISFSLQYKKTNLLTAK
ncbi:MAG: hypothetical protein JWQ27_2713 [Ferruginibacter sp.]|nr:hypothetical protein [Ferruginibacter sp.]